VDDQGNACVFRTVALRPKQPPKSWEQVRDKLVEDLRRRSAYKHAGELAEKLAEHAKEVGLEAAFQADTDLKQQLDDDAYNNVEPFARKRLSVFGGPPRLMPNWIPMLGMDEPLIDRCFAAVAETDSRPSDIFVHEQPERGRWVVVQVFERVPVTREQFKRQREMAVSYNNLDLTIQFLSNWFDSKQIRERIGWKEKKPEPADDETREQAAPA
jgi:hypothetical protein